MYDIISICCTLFWSTYLKWTDCTLTGADANKNDGVYTAYYMKYKRDGVFTIKVHVLTDDTTVVQTKGRIGAFPIGAAQNGIMHHLHCY